MLKIKFINSDIVAKKQELEDEEKGNLLLQFPKRKWKMHVKYIMGFLERRCVNVEL